MIAVDVSGRLGNQMFIYAYALAASRRLRCGYFLIYDAKTSSCFELPKYFKCPSFHAFTNRVKVSLFDIVGVPFQVVEMDPVIPPAELLRAEARWRRFIGYMQSSRFFSGYESLVRSEFEIRDEFRKQFLERYGEAVPGKKRVVVHLRRTDYSHFGSPELGFDLRLPISYYEQCLERIEEADRAEVYFVGDDPEFSRKAFGNGSRFQHVSASVIDDFQLIQSADIAVISNSSFAWWAAYLGSKRTMCVYAPRHWLGFKAGREYPAGIMNPEWQWVDVR